MLETSNLILSGNNTIWVWSVLELLTIVIGFTFIIWQISLHRQKNMLDALLSLDSRWKSERMYNNRKNACERYSREDRSINQDETEILGFFEDLGIFLKRRVFDKNLLWDKYSYYIDNYWSMYKPHIEKYRSDDNDNTWYERFEYLKITMDRVSEKKGLDTSMKSDEEIDTFRKGEENRFI